MPKIQNPKSKIQSPMKVSYTFEPGSWVLGMVWDHKYRTLWVVLPLLCWEVRFRMG